MKTKWADRYSDPEYTAMLMREQIALYVEETFRRDFDKPWRQQLAAEIRKVELPATRPPKPRKKRTRP